MVRDAVEGKPVSSLFSLETGKVQGKIAHRTGKVFVSGRESY